jgi:hypothetical protein
MKNTFGVHSHMLSINSLSESDAPDPSVNDVYSTALQSSFVSSLSTTSPSSRQMPLTKRNSQDDDELLSPAAVQSEMMPTTPTRSSLGRYLSSDDVKGLLAFLRDFVSQSVIPFMERSVSYWNEQVSARFFTALEKKCMEGGEKKGKSRDIRHQPPYPRRNSID